MEAPAGANGGEEPSERAVVEESACLADRARELHDAAAALTSRTSADEQSLRARALALESDLRRLRSSLSTAIKNREVNPMVAEKVEEELDRASYALSEGDAAFLLPGKTQGKFLKMFLGPVNVRAARKDVQLKVKEEYNNYKDRTAILFVLFPSTLLLLRSWIWDGCFPILPVQLYQVWLLFLYTSLALRENVLRANGSDIRPWWIYHHYCAMLMALISLTWEIKGEPDCNFKQRGVQLFLAWAVMQGFAMLLQNRYQRQRLYTRIALGKVLIHCTVKPKEGSLGVSWTFWSLMVPLKSLRFSNPKRRQGRICSSAIYEKTSRSRMCSKALGLQKLMCRRKELMNTIKSWFCSSDIA